MSAAQPPADRSHRQRLIALLGVVVLGVILIMSTMIWMARREALREAAITTRNYASMFEARLDATLRRCDTVLQGLVRTLPKAALNRQAVAGYAEAINAELNVRGANFEEIAGLRVFDANGDLLYTSGPTDVPRGYGKADPGGVPRLAR
ncbi:MAG: hypothetical protein NT042_13775 [Sulfuritalea sp.]|nr:hypothetical protein [Sulfuritalea sp.]